MAIGGGGEEEEAEEEEGDGGEEGTLGSVESGGDDDEVGREGGGDWQQQPAAASTSLWRSQLPWVFSSATWSAAICHGLSGDHLQNAATYSWSPTPEGEKRRALEDSKHRAAEGPRGGRAGNIQTRFGDGGSGGAGFCLHRQSTRPH